MRNWMGMAVLIFVTYIGLHLLVGRSFAWEEYGILLIWAYGFEQIKDRVLSGGNAARLLKYFGAIAVSSIVFAGIALTSKYLAMGAVAALLLVIVFHAGRAEAKTEG